MARWEVTIGFWSTSCLCVGILVVTVTEGDDLEDGEMFIEETTGVVFVVAAMVTTLDLTVVLLLSGFVAASTIAGVEPFPKCSFSPEFPPLFL